MAKNTKVVVMMIFIFSIAGLCNAQQKKTDLEHSGLVGKVKSIKVEEAKLSSKDGKQVEGKKTQTETLNYNEKGALTKTVRFEAGRPTDYYYSNDANGNRLEFSRTSLGENRMTTQFAYDANGNRTEETQTGEGGLVNKVVCVFDAKGRVVERKIFNKQGLFARRAYAYASDANPTQEAEYDAKGALVGQQSYSYELDSTGNWVKRTTSKQVYSNGKQVMEPAAVTYRTISYY